MKRELQDRRGQAGIVSVERNERRKRFELHAQRHFGIGILHQTERIFAAKRNVGETVAIQRVGLIANLQGEFLGERRAGRHGFGIMRIPGAANRQVEDIPVPQPAITAEIELPRANAANRHANLVEFLAAVNRALTPRKQRLHPLRRKLLIGRHQLVEILARERPGHHRQAREGQSGSNERGLFQEAPAVERPFVRIEVRRLHRVHETPCMNWIHSLSILTMSLARDSGVTLSFSNLPALITPSTVVLYGACSLNSQSQSLGHAGSR